MSLSAMTRLAAHEPAAGAAAEEAGAAQEVRQTELEQIAAFIPTEVVGIYIAGLGIFEVGGAGTPPGRGWLVVWTSFALVPFLVFLRRKSLAAAGAARVNGAKVAQLVLFGWVAFAAWAAALPETPFLDEGESRTCAFAVVGLGLVLPGLARQVGPVETRS